MPADRTGVVLLSLIQPTPDGRAYTYSAVKLLSILHLVEGLK